jgi:hypothetical protein
VFFIQMRGRGIKEGRCWLILLVAGRFLHRLPRLRVHFFVCCVGGRGTLLWAISVAGCTVHCWEVDSSVGDAAISLYNSRTTIKVGRFPSSKPCGQFWVQFRMAVWRYETVNFLQQPLHPCWEVFLPQSECNRFSIII